MPAIDNIPEAERWSDASQATRKQAKKSFALPKDVKIILLPSRDTSISEMLLFSTPPHSRRKNNLDPALFFSTEPAQEVDEAELTQLRSLPIPPSTVVRQLDAVSRQQWMDGAKSMSYAHIDGQTRHHPIWLISYWMTVTTLRDTVWKLWQDIDTWLQKNQLQHKIIDRREHAVLTRALLAEVPWSLSKSGMTDKQPMHSLWRLFGESWTNSTVQDNMLDMLRVRATSDPSLADRFIVGHVDLTTKIVEASGHGIGHQVFREGKILVTIIHLGNLGENGADHWVPLVVDGSTLRFLYGDSMGGASPTLPSELAKVFESWAEQHTIYTYSHANIPVTQQKDHCSCGPLSFNALENFVLSDVGLVTVKEIPSLRMRMFNRIVERCLNYSPEIRSPSSSEDECSESDVECCGKETVSDLFSSLSEGKQFTFTSLLPLHAFIPPSTDAITNGLKRRKGKACSACGYFPACDTILRTSRLVRSGVQQSM